MEAATGGLDVGGHGVREGRGALADDLGAARGKLRRSCVLQGNRGKGDRVDLGVVRPDEDLGGK